MTLLRWIVLVAALVVLDASLTFENIWPTPAVQWRGALSIELAVCVLVLAIVSRWFRPLPRVAIGWLSAIWTVLVLGHYAEVTAPALYGRDINLYWDLQFIPDVAAMVTRVASWWLIVLSVSAAVLTLILLYALVRRAWRCVAAALTDDNQCRALIALSLAVVALFIVTPAKAEVPGEDTVHRFASPVVLTYARQVRFVVEAMAGSRTLPDSPPMTFDFSRVQGADVYLVFVESYGAVSFDRPALARPIAASRARLDAAIRETGRQVISAFVESPTFGGSSWLAHISLLSGIEVRDPDTNAKLMTAQRDTLAKAFGRRGFRTVGLMPGLRQSWPEGVFYGFNEIYGAERLDYRGPEFGWFALPDQYSLARFDALEEARGSAGQRFIFFPTISTHFPFRPTPPYQPDWPRMLTPRPYDPSDIVRAYAHQPDWTNFGPGYVEAMTYDLDMLAGYLKRHADRDLVMIVLGDHQPPAAVSGEHASWDVPVHVIASRAAVLDRLLSAGFTPGLTPTRHPIGRMHQLLPKLLDAFGDVASKPPGVGSQPSADSR
ncbi:MAG TPA: hypothetical protein VK504_24085 [Vicinamibacterales bacterium]|jgi:hypothetical protein|nr:hypothetical protein [Vicinamibacterales bacterium]